MRCAGLGIVYMITGGSAMLRVWQLYGDNQTHPFGLSCWILVFFGLQLFLSQVRAAILAAVCPSNLHPVVIKQTL